MSKVIDQQVVEMRFDNDQFERGVEQSTKSIDKLKNSLDFSGLSNNVSGIGLSIDSISDKLSPFGEVWRSVWNNVGDIVFSTVGAINNAIQSLGVDQIFAGFAKYSQITKSTQTMMAATRHEWEDTRKQMDYVNEQLLKLAWFTDETSYSFTEMVNTVGKFTSSGIAPDDAVTTMMGIATWGGIAGASIEEVNRVYYNMAQAVSSGSIRVVDWASVESANMNVRELEQLFIDTAVKLGTLKRNEDGYTYAIKETKKGVEELKVSVDNFRTTLNKDYGLWFTKDVFVEAMKYMGDFEEAMYKHINIIGETYDMSTTEMISYVDDYVELATQITDVTEDEMRKLSILGDEMPSITANLFSDYLDDGEINDYAKACESLAKAYGLTSKAFEDAVADYHELDTDELDDYEGSLAELAETYGLTAEQLTEMYKAYDKIDATTDTLEKLAETYGLTTEELTGFFEQYRGTMMDLDYLTTMMGGDEEAARALQAALKDLSREEYELGRTAMKASQESRTFQDSFQATQDALSTKWMMIFQTVLGDYLQSVELWSTVTDEMWHLFVENIENLYDIIVEFGELGGRDILLDGVRNAWEAIRGVIDAVQGGVSDLFPEASGERLITMAEAFRDFTEDLKLSDGRLYQLRTSISFIGQTAKNVWDTAKSLLMTLVSAFSDIFPKGKSGIELFRDITREIRKFSEQVKEFVDNNSNKFERAFKGIFAVGDILLRLFKALLSPFIGVTDTAGDLADNILDVAASFGDWLVKLDKYIAENDVFNKAIASVQQFFIDIYDGINKVAVALTGSNLEEIWVLITDNANQATSSISGFFRQFFTGDADEAEDKATGIAAIFETLTGWVQTLKDEWAKAQPYFDQFVETLGDTFEIDLMSWEDIQKAFREGGALAVIFLMIQTIYQLYHEITWFFSQAPIIIKESLANINLLVEGISETMWSLQNRIKSGTISKMARAILYLAVAMTLISMIKTDKLQDAVAIIVLMFGELAGMFVILKNTVSTMDTVQTYMIGKVLKDMGKALIFIAAAIWMVAKASDDPKAIWTAAGALGAMMAAFAIMIGLLDKFKVDGKKASAIASAMMVLGIALILFSAAIAIIVSVSDDPGKVWNAVGVLIAMIAAIGALMTQAKKISAGKVVAIAGSLVIISMALILMSSAIAILAKAAEDPTLIVVATFSLVALMAVIIALMKGAEGLNPGKMAAIAGSLIIVGIALLLMASAVAIVARVPVDTLSQGLGGLIALLVVTGIVLAGLAQIKGNLIEGAAAITVAALGLVLMAYALSMLAEIPDPLEVIVLFGACLLILVGLSAIAMKVAPGLYAIGVAMALLGLGALLAGEGMLKMSEAIEKLINLGKEGVDVLDYAIERAGELLPGFIAAFVDGIGLFLASVINLAPTILEAFTVFLSVFLTGISILLPLIREVALQLLYTFRDVTVDFLPVLVDLLTFVTRELLRSMTTLTPEITAAAMFILIDTLKQIAANIFEVTYLLTDIALKVTFGLLEALIDHIPDFIQTGIDFVISLLDGLALGIENNRERVRDAIIHLGEVIIDTICWVLGINSPSKEFEDVAKYCLDGLIGGFVDTEKIHEIVEKLTELKDKILETVGGVVDKVKKIGEDIMKGLSEGMRNFAEDPIGAISDGCEAVVGWAQGIFDSHSPSRVFMGIGEDIDEGLAIGIEDNMPLVATATEEMGEEAIDGISNTIADLSSVIDGEMDTSPTIRPVLDLTDVVDGVGIMDGMLTSDRAIGLAGYNSNMMNASMLAQDPLTMAIENLKATLGGNGGSGMVQNNTFNINGAEDPKAVADKISTILQNQVERRNAVWA